MNGKSSADWRLRYIYYGSVRKGKSMAPRNKAQVRGMLYNVRSVVEGLIKLIETDVLSPEQAEEGLCKAIAKEMGAEAAQS